MTTTICECGHAERIHSVLEGIECRVCACEAFTPATDPDAATEAARSSQAAEERLWRVLRRAVNDRDMLTISQALEELT